MTLSNQAIGAIMMALQNAILNQEDVTKTLQDFQLGVQEDNTLVVVNAPSTKPPEEDDA